MKFVVVGIPGVTSRTISSWSRRQRSSMSELKRLKSRRCEGFGMYCVLCGAWMSSHEEYTCDQKAVFQVAFTRSRSP